MGIMYFGDVFETGLTYSKVDKSRKPNLQESISKAINMQSSVAQEAVTQCHTKILIVISQKQVSKSLHVKFTNMILTTRF